MGNLITNFDSKPAPATEPKKAAPYSFGTKEFTDLRSSLLSSVPLNRANDMKKFETATKQRGYDFFSSQSLQNWKDIYPYDDIDALTISAAQTKVFMNSVADPSSPDHDRNRTLLLTFNNDVEKVKQYFLNKDREEFGLAFKPWQDLSHEARILKIDRPLNSQHAIFEYDTYKKLILSKWRAVGYSFDQEYKQKFLNDYSIALK